MANSRTFWSWHRVGLASAVAGIPASGARARLPARISLDATHSADVPVDLLGPGDVTGLDPVEIVRCEPSDGNTNFPPSEFPYVELRHADLPWRFTPVGPVTGTIADPEHPAGPAVAQSRLQPWIALVVVPADASALTRGADGRARLQCAATLLPDVREAWAWAHVQLTGTVVGDPLAALSDPGQAFARLLCPIRLQADTRYVSAIVPTYAAGLAAAGLPLPGSVVPLDPAWGASGDVTLPVYHSTTFTTGQAGSFESLARRLRPRPAPATANGVPLRIDAAGWGASAPAGRTVLVQGALRPLAGATGDAPADATFAASLAAALSSPAGVVQLRPPLYGQDHARGATSVVAGASGWFSQLNTDARRRFAAGLGSWAVAVDQEDLCDRAWQQLAVSGVPASGTAAADISSAVLGALAERHATTAGSGPSGALASAALTAGPTAGPIAGLATRLATGLSTDTATQPDGVPAAPDASPPSPDSVLARMLRPGGTLARIGFGAITSLAAVPSTAETAVGSASIARSAVPAAAQQVQAPSRFCPTFVDDGLQRLQSTAPEWVLPGLDDLPEDSIVLMRTNPAFVEAFLIGLNHAMARELQWRRYPLDLDGTMFTRFWPTTTATPQDMTPMASWSATSDLGSHVGGVGNIVMVVRGGLLRRFPTATIYLSGRVGTGPETVVTPTIAAYAGTDTTMVGFPMTADQLLHPATPGQVWSVVLQESVQHARFGIDDAPTNGSTAPLTTWQDLDWAHPHVAGSTHVRVAGPLVGVGRQTGPTSALGAPPVSTWAANSSAMAAALTRAPVRVRIPASLWLTPTTP